MSNGYRVACPKCGAEPYKSCRSLTKGKTTDTHTARIKANTQQFLGIRRTPDE